MAVLVTSNIWAEITAAAKSAKAPSQVAVAYFSNQGPSLLPLTKGSVLIADVSISTVAQGATSPAALEKLRKKGVDIYSAQHLHAKAFAFDNVAFVGSTNASYNSSNVLVEASLKTNVKNEIDDVRSFVTSLCVTKLKESDLKQLSNFYKPPTIQYLSPGQQNKYSTLLMQLTLEQGVDRATQIQPPKSVWANFFGLTFPKDGPPTLPKLTLFSEKSGLSKVRPVLKHHHTYTVEIPDADMPRPAILQMRRLGVNKYSYVVHRPADPKFPAVSHLVQTLHNPFWKSGRRWIVI